MSKEFIGVLSGILVVVSAIPYMIRVGQKKIRPNITSWSLWSLIGFALLVTYKDAGAEANVWPAVFGFTNPTIIAALAIWNRGDREAFTKWEVCSGVACSASLVMWWMLRGNKELVQYALYAAILADIFAVAPTLAYVWHKPFEDRPGAWVLFAFAYALSVFAISDQTFANYILPIYMFCGALSVAALLTFPRVKSGTPLNEWI